MRQYLRMVEEIRHSPTYRGDRTGTGAQSIFGHQLRFDLAEGFPLVTTKFVPVKSIIDELLWFLDGDTNNETLLKNKCNIWKEWAVADQTRRTYTDEERVGKFLDIVKAEGYEGVAIHLATQEPPADEIPQDGQLHLYGNVTLLELADRYGIPTEEVINGPMHGELGPVYGAQWRRWEDVKIVPQSTPKEDQLRQEGYELMGSYYNNADGLSYSVLRKEIDQFAELMEGLRKKPFSRRHLLSAWNPADLPNESIPPQANVMQGKMALAPCHALFQFYVDYRSPEALKADAGAELWAQCQAQIDQVLATPNISEFHAWTSIYRELEALLQPAGIKTRRLSCQLYQRSCDTMLGVPFNIASYSLLTMMMAQCLDMVAGDFIWVGGDVHIYSNHFEGVAEQLGRSPKALPKMWINPEVKDIFAFQREDFRLEEYVHDPKIVFNIAV